MKHATLDEHDTRRARGWLGASMAAALLLAACGGGGGDESAPTEQANAAQSSPSCDSRVNNTHAKLLECVTLEGVREHQAAFQAIADANGGTRAAGTPGYDASVDYVVDRLTAAGYQVTLNAFPFVYIAPAVLQQTDADRRDLRDRCLHRHGHRQRHGRRHRGRRQARPAPRPGHERLRGGRLRRLPGRQHRADPARHLHLRAEGGERAGAGASAVIIFNQGNTPER